jgi:hypothetical protein
MRGNEPRPKSWFVCDALREPPASWVPPYVPPSLAPPSSDNELPTSLERGGAGVAGIHASTVAVGIGNRAHIPHRWGGAPCGQSSIVVDELGGKSVVRVVVEAGKMNQTSTVDMVDVEFKLHLRAKESCSILTDMSTIMKINIPCIH